MLDAGVQEPGKLAWAREVIGRQLQQLVRLVDDLLDVSRITRGKIKLKIESIDVARVVAAAVETSRPYVDALEHALIVSLPPEPLRLKGDFARVAQIPVNLINNAAKYTDKGGRIIVTASSEGTEIVFRVCDSGMGIPQELLSTARRSTRQTLVSTSPQLAAIRTRPPKHLGSTKVSGRDLSFSNRRLQDRWEGYEVEGTVEELRGGALPLRLSAARVLINARAFDASKDLSKNRSAPSRTLRFWYSASA